ncbi:ABC transporter substrate-binding protein [Nocardiopsis dassonvillei]|jgi:multiple sugar transport system substrate-binding protein|uniref:ABC transporter substrate-binding protein n=1 Tax=Nocardiopsis dassonvillei TaxID=2014 RepID=UPI0010EA8AFA|nr:ABC transporter substrate-binding protein [Nocardiopsis dassonvillei]MCP3013749.1 ABC transporter substrate-binding protein [Nocardiopsis dassonvillei]
MPVHSHQKGYKVRACAAGLAALSLTLATACGEPPGEETAGEGGETAGLAEDPAFVWAVTGADRAIHEEVARLWNENNPDQQVDIFFLAPTADEQRQAMFQDLQNQAGEFDVLGLDVIWTGEFAEYGYVESLEDLRGEVEGVSLEGAVDSSQWQQELFALPYSSNGAFLYYRTDLIEEPPTTWEELYDTGMAAAEEEGISAYVGQGDQYEGFVVNFLELYWSAGGQLFDDAQEQSTFLEGDAATTALDFMTEAYESGFYADGFDTMVEDDARALFQAGEAVYMRNWPYAIPLLAGEGDEESAVADDFAVAPLPTFTGEGTTSALGGLNNAVSTLSDSKDLAREFVLWAATDPEAQDILLQNSLPPTMASAYENTDDPDFQMLGDILAQAQARPPVPGYNSLSLAVQDNLHPAFRGQEESGTALEAVDQAANDALEQE